MFALGVALAAFAGMIAAPVSSVFPGMGNQVLIICFVVVVIGGIGSVKGAMVGALLIGLVDTFGKVAEVSIGGLRVLPELAGMIDLRADGRRAAVAAGRPLRTRLQVTPQPRARRASLLGLRGAAARCCRWFAEKFYVQFATRILIMAIFAMSLDLLVGYTGLVSLGHAAFFGLAGYTLALVSPQYEAASLWTQPAARGRRCGAASRWPSARWRCAPRGVYFIMVTLAFAQMLYFVFHDTKIAGGSDGIYIYVRPVADLFGWRPSRSRERRALLLRDPGARRRRCSWLLRRDAALAVRPRARRHPGERASHALARLSDVPLQAGLLRARRQDSPASPATSRRCSTAS